MDFKNTVFYVEDGKFYISRYVLIAIFRLLVGSQRPDSWPDDLLLSRFGRSIPFYPKEKAGVFSPVFERAASVPVENWILTDVPLPHLETLYPQLPALSDSNTHAAEANDTDDNTLEVQAPAAFFSAINPEPVHCWKQRPKFQFSDFDIPSGSVLTFKRDPSVIVITSDDKTGVISDDHNIGSSWTDITRQLTGFSQVAPVDYWCYNGTSLRKMYNAKYGGSHKKTPKKPSPKNVILSAEPSHVPPATPSPLPITKPTPSKSEVPPPILKRSFDFSLSAPVAIITSRGH
jgi:hypothetical protein